MRDAFTMRFRPEVAAFVQAQPSASNRSVTNFVETLLLREKARFEEGQRQLTVQATADLAPSPHRRKNGQPTEQIRNLLQISVAIACS